MARFDYDVFISHASEDKSVFVTPLAHALRTFGLNVWFDNFTLKVGDSLHDSIERGLARSRYGVVVLSLKFISKRWPREELNGLFARQVGGRKVILPVWHEISAAQMRRHLPMLADKYAPQSSDGIEAVARLLVETIRPELLELDVRQASAFEAGESFISEARKKHPGYDFTVQTGSVDDSLSPNTILAASSGRRRIEIRVSDPTAIASPPGGNVLFFGEGAQKAIEFERTGKPQMWEPGEFALEHWDIPLMPANVEGSTLAVGERQFPHVPPRQVRVEVGSPPSVVFPIMEMRPTRMGTHEAEAVISDSESPLAISIVSPVGIDSFSDNPPKLDFKFSWKKTTGKKVSECKKLIDAVDTLCSGNILRVIDLRLDAPILESPARVADTVDPFAVHFRRTILLASQIEKEFSILLRMPEVKSDEDGESLFHLDCLLNGHEYGRVENNTLRLFKAGGEEGAAQEAFIKGDLSVTFTAPPSNYPGHFPLFGQRIQTRPWVRVMEFVPIEPGADAKAYAEALIGSEFIVKVTAKGPAYLRWDGQEKATSLDGHKNGSALSPGQMDADKA
jgi:TIR domain